MSDPIKASAQQLAQETIDTRRDFHQHPEIAFEEERTSAIVAERLQSYGLAVRRQVGKTGVIGVLDTGREGKTVLARADMDALPIHDEKDVSYRSTVAGKMHACGHDGHTAVLLSSAKILSQQHDDLRGKIVFVFQPAEEVVGGAEAMLADNALGDLKPDSSIGLHLSSMLPSGVIGVREGPAMAASEAFELNIKGRGGHAARPQEVIDPVLITGHVISGIQSLISRELDPLDQAVISLCAIQGGTAFNIIPEEVNIKATLRTFKPETRQMMHRRIAEFVQGMAQSFRGSAEVAFTRGTPAVINDATMTERLKNVARGIVGHERVTTPDPIMGGDDMSLWLQQAAGCYFFVGSGNEALGSHYAHHHPMFDLDESSLPLAVEVLSKGIVDYLQ